MDDNDKAAILKGKTLTCIGGHPNTVGVVFHFGQFKRSSMHFEIFINRCFVHRMNVMMDKRSIVKREPCESRSRTALDNQCRHDFEIQREHEDCRDREHSRDDRRPAGYPRSFHTAHTNKRRGTQCPAPLFLMLEIWERDYFRTPFSLKNFSAPGCRGIDMPSRAEGMVTFLP